jgi:hypothetical protein
VVVVAALRRAFGVAARPGGYVHSEHRRVGIGHVAGEQVLQPLGVDAAAGQCGVDAAPAAPADRLQAQVRQRSDRRGAPQLVAQVEQRIGAAGAAGVGLGPEAAEPHQGEVGVGMAPQPDTRCLQAI